MDATLKGVLGLLGGTDVEARCAALLVLARLQVRDRAPVDAAGIALSAKNVVVRDFALSYFEQVRPAEGVGYLVPLLDQEDDGLRQRAVAALATYGQAAVAAVKKLVGAGPRRRLHAIIDLCVRVRTVTALDVLSDQIASEDFDVSRIACDALIAVVPSLDAKERIDLLARGERLIAGAKGQRSALVGGAKLLGALADAKARRRLLPLIDKAHSHAVRTHAVGALLQCLRGQTLTSAEISAVLPLLDEEDEAGLLRPAIHLLEDQSLDRSY